MSDNIGGISLASYCFVDDILSCAVLKNGIAVNFKKNKFWVEFNASLGNIDISVQENEVNGTSLFNVAGKIRCPRQKFEKVTEMNIPSGKRILLKYNTINGDILVAGDRENTIKVTAKILNPKDASGYSGVEYTLVGTMKHAELPLL